MIKKIIYLSFILFLITPIDLEAQCSMCRAVLESEEGQQTARGINDGIVYLMAIPYVLVGIVAVSYTHLTLPTTPYV